MVVQILDDEAVSALGRPRRNPERHQQVRAAMRSAYGRNAPLRIASAVLVELYRRHGTDQPIDPLLGRGFAQVVSTGTRIARIAGHLLADAGAGAESELAIDALAVATAIRLGGGLVVTHDPEDLRRLAGQHTNVAILEI